MKFDDNREGNLAEIVFYGRKQGTEEEQALNGFAFGVPENEIETGWEQAVDGDYSTYFRKDKKVEGYVALDLGERNDHTLTRIRYVPRSDTNFITDYYLDFQKVPAGKLYILHNLSGGAEERIFIYKNGIQQWW